MIISLLSVAIAVVSLGYAIQTNREKARWERLVREGLAGIAGNIQKCVESADGSDRNFSRVRDCTLKLEKNEDVNKILEHAHNGARDSVAAKRMLINLRGQVLSMQKGLFDTEFVAFPDREAEPIHEEGQK